MEHKAVPTNFVRQHEFDNFGIYKFLWHCDGLSLTEIARDADVPKIVVIVSNFPRLSKLNNYNFRIKTTPNSIKKSI